MSAYGGIYCTAQYSMAECTVVKKCRGAEVLYNSPPHHPSTVAHVPSEFSPGFAVNCSHMAGQMVNKPFKGTGTRDFIWLKVVSLDRFLFF